MLILKSIITDKWLFISKERCNVKKSLAVVCFEDRKCLKQALVQVFVPLFVMICPVDEVRFSTVYYHLKRFYNRMPFSIYLKFCTCIFFKTHTCFHVIYALKIFLFQKSRSDKLYALWMTVFLQLTLAHIFFSSACKDCTQYFCILCVQL